MKAVSRVVMSLALALPAAAQQYVEVEETGLPASLASTVQTIFSQCSNCSVLDVHAFDVLVPEEGSIDQDAASQAAIDYLGAWLYWSGWHLSQASFDSWMAGWNYEELPPAIRSSIAPGDTSWTVNQSWWYYPVAPDYCDYGYMFVLVFHDSRKVVTVEVVNGRDC